MRIIGTKTLWEGRFIKTVLISYEDRHGVRQTWEAVERVGVSGVVIVVPFTAEDEIILIKQYRPVLDKRVIELPAGLVDDGEDVLDAARREMVEETGHYPRNMESILRGTVSNGINTEPWHIVIASGARTATPEEVQRHRPDDNEDIEVFKLPLASFYQDLDALEDDGTLIDIRIYGLVELARRRLGLSLG